MRESTRYSRRLLAILMSSLVGSQSLAAEPADKADLERIKAGIIEKLPGVEIDDILRVDGADLLEVKINKNTGYVTPDGKFLVMGDLIDLASRQNISETRRAATRIGDLETISDKDAIIFGPADAKHTITVFTDPDCTYCRKLHSEIGAINKLGIRVRYLAFPRSGPGTESWKKTEAVWCSNDRTTALTRAKLGHAVAASACSTPVEAEFKMGERMGVKGTPAILTEDAILISGYTPPDQLLARLELLRKQKGK